MMMATVKGRVQTKLLTLAILAGITALFVLISGRGVYVDLLVTAVVVGLALEALWGVVIEYQPGWLTFVLGAVEFVAIAVVATTAGVVVAMPVAAGYYGVSWVIIQLFLLYVLPVWRWSWVEDGGELW